MGLKLFKLFFLSVLIWIVLLLGLVPGVFFVYNSGQELIEEMESEARSRGRELAATIGTLAQESSDPDTVVALCQTMNAMVTGSRNRSPGLSVEEAFFIDREGTVIAHNDIAKVASQASVNYDEKKYTDAANRWMKNPVVVEPIGSVQSINDEYLDQLIPVIQQYMPGLLVNRYHASFAVYPPDEDFPSGSVHLMLYNRSLETSLASFLYSLVSVIGISLLAHFLLWLGFTIFGAVWIFRKRSDPGTAITVAQRPLRDIPVRPGPAKVEKAPDPVAIESKQNSEVVILDAIPLDIPEKR